MLKNRFKPSNRFRGIVVVLVLGALVNLAPSLPVFSIATLKTTVPLTGDTVLHSSPATADFDGDLDKEIAIGGRDGTLYVIAYNGSSWAVGWSRQTAQDLVAAGAPTTSPCVPDKSDVSSAPAIADLDQDGSLEIVVSVGGDPAQHRNGGVLVYTYDSTKAWGEANVFTLVSGWPQPRDSHNDSNNGDGCWDGFLSSPAVGDLDGNGDLEVVIEGLDRRIHAWHHDGTAVSGWPIYRYDESGQETNGDCLLRGGVSSPALGDIDDDGLPEVVVGTNSPPWNCPGNWDQIDYRYATVWAINGDGTSVPGWPVRTDNNIESSPALGDIDGDGELEIVVGSGDSQEGGNGRKVYAWKGDGTPLSGWPQTTAGDVEAPPALGDLDGDNVPDVIVGCGTEGVASCKKLYAWRGNGSLLPGFPWSTDQSLPYAPLLADYDGDSQVEILVAKWPTEIAVIDRDGVARDAVFSTLALLASAPVVDDVDNDGKLEVVVGCAGLVYIWDVDGNQDGEVPWPMFHHDLRRTGQYPTPPRLGFVDEIRVYHQEGSGSTATEYAVLRNRGDGEFDWSISESISALTVSPSSGVVTDTVRVRFDINVTGIATGTWQDLGDITVSGTFDGDPVFDSPKTVPVYLFVGNIGRAYLPLAVRNAAN